MTMQPGSLRYNLPTNDFSINPIGTEDGWAPLYLSSDAEDLTKTDLESWAEKLGGRNQSKLYVDNSSPLASDSKNNRGNSKLRPFKTIERALAEAARISFKKNPLNSQAQNDLYERISINVAPGEYNVQNGPRSELNTFLYYEDYLNASHLISINKENLIESLSIADNNLKLDTEYFVNSLIADLVAGGNLYSLKFARSLVTSDSNITLQDNNPPQNYFISRYSDENLRTYFNTLLTTTLKSILYLIIENKGVEFDFSRSIAETELNNIKNTIEELINIISDTLICDIDPRDTSLINYGKYNVISFPEEEPTLADLQRFNSANKPGIILPRGVSIVGDDLRKVVIRPTYVPDPKNVLEGRGAIFRMTGGNFFSGFTIKDHIDFKESHHKLSGFEFCTRDDLEDYYTQINTAFSDRSIYSRALFSSKLIEDNEDWIKQQTLLNASSVGFSSYSLVFENEIHSLLVSIQRDLKALTNTNVFSWGSKFYTNHILPLSILNRPAAITYYQDQIDVAYLYIIKSVVNSGQYVDLNNIDSKIEQFSLNGVEFEGRNADIQAAIFVYKEIVKSLIGGIQPTQTEFSEKFTSSDIEVINEETSIVLGLQEEENILESKINTVKGASPYIFSASIRSEYGLCGIDGDGSSITGLRSYLAAQFTIVSLQKDPNAFVLDENLVGNKRYKGSVSTDAEDWRHFGYRVDNEAYSQLVSCFCIGPAIHYVAEGGAEFSITNSTSNFGDISLYSKGFIDNKNGGGAYPQDKGHKIIGIKKPAPFNNEPQTFTIGYLRNEGTILQSETPTQTGKILLSGELRDYNYELIDSIIRINVGSTPSKARIKTIEVVNNIVELGVEFLTDFNTTWNSDPTSDQYIFGIVGKPIYIRRFIDTRDNTDKFYKLILERPSNPDTRKPVLNYILRKGDVNNAESQPFNTDEVGRIFYLGEINETDSSYECLFISAYYDTEGRTKYYDDLIESADLGSIANANPDELIDPDLNNFSQPHNSLNKFDIQIVLNLLGIIVDTSELNLTEDREIIFDPELDLDLEFNKPSVIRCSGHTWEYLGYLNYDSSIPKLQTKNIGFGLNEEETRKLKLLKTQTELIGGRVYTTGMDEEGNQYVGNRILDLKSGNEKVVSRGDSPAFEPQIVSVFEDLTVINKLDSNNTQTENLLVKSSFTTENISINDNSIIINADASENEQDQKLILTRNYTQQNAPIEFFLPPDAGQSNQVLTTDGFGYLRWATPYSNVIISDQTPYLRNDGTDLESGDLWWKSNGGELFIYYDDGSIEVGDDFNSSKQWVEIGGEGGDASILLSESKNVIISTTPPTIREDGTFLRNGDLWWKIYENPDIPGELWLYINNEWNPIITSDNSESTSTWVKVGENILGDSSSNFFGRRVTISSDGQVAAASSSGSFNGLTRNGQVKVYRRNNNNNWDLINDPIYGESDDDILGSSVSLSEDGTYLAIGIDRFGKTPEEAGSVKIFMNQNNAWVQVGDSISGESSGDRFGSSVSISKDGSTVAIGAPRGTPSYARVYSLDSNNNWVKLGADDSILSGELGFELFGTSLSLTKISNNKLILCVGSPGDDDETDPQNIKQQSGSIKVYEFNQNSQEWEQLGETIFGEAADDGLGNSVAISEDGLTIIAGTNSSIVGSTPKGVARIYKYINQIWTKIGNDLEGESVGDQFGKEVSISGDGSIVAISSTVYDSARGYVRIFQNIDNLWEQLGDNNIEGESINEASGHSISIAEDGKTIAIGSIRNSLNGLNAGCLRIYELKTTGGLNLINPSRIPDLDADKITTGIFDSDRIPNLDASKITTGTLDNARLPELPPSYLYRSFIF